MATRYKGYKSLNKMIEELENTVITVNETTGEPITPNIVTKRSIADIYSNVIDKKTGRFLSYQEAQSKVSRTSGQTLTYNEYLSQIHEFQDTGLSKQLTLEGEMNYQIERGIKIFGEDVMNDLMDSISYSNYRLIIDKIGRLSNRLVETSSNYTSNTFYDMISFVIEQMENGVDINSAIDITETYFESTYTNNQNGNK